MIVRQEKFEGPLGLLLQLIEREELDITQISLAKIADQYVEYINNSPGIKPDEMADFLVVAARLLLVKSKALLPYLYPEEKEELDDLEEQLRMYKEFLEASKKIAGLIGKKRFMFWRDPSKIGRRNIFAGITDTNVFSPPKNIKSADLFSAFSELLRRAKPSEIMEEEMLEHKINMEEKIAAIQKMLIEKIRVSFNALMSGAKSKTEAIVNFLALLELIKQREVFVLQNGLFAEIEISKFKYNSNPSRNTAG